MSINKAYSILVFFFILTSFLGILYQDTLFEIERIHLDMADSEFHKEESMYLSPYRNEFQPITILILMLFVGLNIYLFLFRFKIVLKFYKILLLSASIYSFILLSQVVFSNILPILDPGRSIPRAIVGNLLIVVGIIMPIAVLRTKYKNTMQNILGVALCGVLGVSVAQYFNYVLLLVALGFISIFDYINVRKTKKIPKILDMVEKENLIMTLGVISHEFDQSGKKVEVVHQLGYGDLIFSNALAVSLFIDKNVYLALLTLFFMTLSLWLFIYIGTNRYTEESLPAIPPIFIGGLIGVILYKLIEFII